MSTYKINEENKWDYENGYYLTCETGRIGKFINHYEIYKSITNIPGHIMEFGVYKGSSLIRLLSFRDLLEHPQSRKIVGFDSFGKFPNDLELEEDQKFVRSFESAGGFGIDKEDLEYYLNKKGTQNYELIKGDILKTLPTYINNNPAFKVAFLHIDVDVYEPTKLILEELWNKIVPGGVIVLDDYGTVKGETKAVDQFFKDKNIQINKKPYYHIPSYIVKK